MTVFSVIIHRIVLLLQVSPVNSTVLCYLFCFLVHFLRLPGFLAVCWTMDSSMCFPGFICLFGIYSVILNTTSHYSLFKSLLGIKFRLLCLSVFLLVGGEHRPTKEWMKHVNYPQHVQGIQEKEGGKFFVFF